MSIPGRVDAAMQYLRLTEDLRNPPPRFDGQRVEPQDLTDAESLTRDAALSVLRAYFSGEADYGDVRPAATGQPEGVKTPIPAVNEAGATP